MGPAIYLARIFNTDIDTVVKFFIFFLIFVFDPMAIALVLAYNRTLQDEQGDVDTINKIYENYKKNPKVIKTESVETKPEEDVQVKRVENNIGKGGRAGK